MANMRTRISLALGAAAVGAVVFAGSSLGTTEAFYWSSFDAERAVENSDWGDARGVANVDCAGKGAHRKDIIDQFTFARFRCELENRNYDRLGFVTVLTTGPESFKTIGYIRARCG